MKITTAGNCENRAVLCIPGMFCTSDTVMNFAKYLQDDYYLILPTLDGHHKEQPEYISKQEDADKIIEWLHRNNISSLAMLQGTSMGAEVALEVASRCDIPIEHYFYDGGPFFYFPRFFRAFMSLKFKGIINSARGKDPKAAADSLLQNSFIKALGGNSLDSYRCMLEVFAEIGQFIDNKSIRRISDTCYKCELPELSREIQSKSIFFFSEKEPARKSEKRLKKKYKFAAFEMAKGYGHCGFQSVEPKKYAMRLKEILEQSK